jgi:hypothetical protein
MAGFGKVFGGAALLALVLGHVASAQEVSIEEARLGASQVRLYVHPFLSPDELATLRLVMTNEQALALFVPGTNGFAALAASPSQGVIRDGKPVASAIALADLPDAAAAAKAATAACDGARGEGDPCVVVLEIAPAP